MGKVIRIADRRFTREETRVIPLWPGFVVFPPRLKLKLRSATIVPLGRAGQNKTASTYIIEIPL
jgi:hypothetical protein